MILLQIILATFLVALLSLIGMFLIYLKSRSLNKILLALVALSAGAMFGNSIFHLLPEAISEAEVAGMSLLTVMIILTIGFVLSFLFETVFSWHHCHRATHSGEEEPTFHCHHEVKPFSQLILYSDAIHNFIDGLIIAAAFIVEPALGVATTIAVALHEVPQELGDFAVLIYGGYKKKRALILNFLAASTVLVGGIAGFFLTSVVDTAVPILLPFAAGSFLYIAAADLLPELKHDEKIKETLFHFFVFLFGLLIMIGFAFVM